MLIIVHKNLSFLFL